MVDVVSPEKRSQMMAGIRGKDTKLELILRRGLHRLGLRFRLHRTGLPGKPDLVFPRHRAVLFVQGCFWHGHGCHLFKWPNTRVEFWRGKIETNRVRDAETISELKSLGWRVAVIWECSIKGKQRWPTETVINRAAAWLRGTDKHLEIAGCD